MDTKEMYKKLAEISNSWELGYSCESMLVQTYEAGYAAARDEAIRILSAREDNDYDA